LPYLEEYRARVGTRAARFPWRSAVGHVGSRGEKTYKGTVIQCAVVIGTLLIIGGLQLNPGPVENIVQVSCSGCNRTFKVGNNATRVAGGTTAAVEMLNSKRPRVLVLYCENSCGVLCCFREMFVLFPSRMYGLRKHCHRA
jgi:hypothetical protein